MLIILDNLKSHYEIEQLTRMFTKDITVVCDGGEYQQQNDILTVKRDEKVSINLCCNGKNYDQTIPADTDEDKMMLDICAVIYSMYTEAFGKKLAWGMLTGVRPVRLMRNLYAKHGSFDKVQDIFKNQYFVSDEKIKADGAAFSKKA